MKYFNWENSFNGKNINSKVELFNETIMNIFSNVTLNKIKAFRNSDPSWMNDDVKNKTKLKHKLYHRYWRQKRSNKDFAKLENFRNEIDNLISKSKKKYYQNINKKLNDPLTSSKTYLSTTKTFFNGKKVPVSDFREKANIFNSLLAKQCILVLIWYSKTLWLLVHLLPNGKEQILFQSIKRMTNKYQIIDQHLFYLYTVKLLKS